MVQNLNNSIMKKIVIHLKNGQKIKKGQKSYDQCSEIAEFNVFTTEIARLDFLSKGKLVHSHIVKETPVIVDNTIIFDYKNKYILTPAKDETTTDILSR